MNQINLTGRLTKKPEVRTTQNGTQVASFTLAVKRDFKNNRGEYEADFINCTAYNQRAELMAKYTDRGMMIGTSGRLQTGSYEKNGQRMYTQNVIVDTIEFLSKKETDVSGMTNSEIVQEVMKDDPWSDMGEVISDSDLPF